MLTVGSLFSGIGGFDLGLERAGMKVIWQSEIDPYACAVLRKHWPNIPVYGDIKTIGAHHLEFPDIICGGPPCQRTSVAAAIQGKRTGATMWPSMLAVVRGLRPDWVLVEQPPAIAGWRESVTSGLETAGYHVSQFELSSAFCGAVHRRRRMFHVANAVRERCDQVARIARSSAAAEFERTAPPRGTWAQTGTGNRRMDARFPDWVDRLRCLGNALDPRVAEIIGRAIIESAP